MSPRGFQRGNRQRPLRFPINQLTHPNIQKTPPLLQRLERIPRPPLHLTPQTHTIPSPNKLHKLFILVCERIPAFALDFAGPFAPADGAEGGGGEDDGEGEEEGGEEGFEGYVEGEGGACGACDGGWVGEEGVFVGGVDAGMEC